MSAPVDKNIINEERMEKPRKCYGARHTQFILLGFATIIGYGMRSVLMFAIVPMTAKEPPSEGVPTYPEWDNKNIIQSAFFWGYVIPQIGAGQLAKHYGPKRFLAMAMLVSAIATIMVPPIAAWCGSYGVIGFRIVEGIAQGFFFPSIHTALGKWLPVAERSRIGTFVYVGGPLGTMISMPLTGFISDTAVGWHVAFYVYGAFGLMWFVLYLIFGANCPEEHKTITKEEKAYIKYNNDNEGHQKKVRTPWRAIFTSMPFIAIFVAHCGQNWAFWTLMNAIPSYMSGVMKYNIKDNGVLSALPYLVLCILSTVFSPISDYLITSKKLSTGTARKVFNSIGKFIPAASLVALGFVDSSQKELAVTLLVISVGVNAAIYCGFNVNHIDLSPVHAGTLMGITNGCSNLFSIAAPLLMQEIINNHEDDPGRWRIIFFVSAGFLIAGGTFYIFFAKGHLQPWNNEGTEEEDENDIKQKKKHSCAQSETPSYIITDITIKEPIKDNLI